MLANIRRFAALAAVLAALTAAILLAPVAWSHPAGAPDGGAATLAYEAGLEAYDEGQYAEALALFGRAAAAGHPKAQAIAGVMNRLGPGCYIEPDTGAR